MNRNETDSRYMPSVYFSLSSFFFFYPVRSQLDDDENDRGGDDGVTLSQRKESTDQILFLPLS